MNLNYSGLVIAGIGFFLTRFTVALSINESALQFYLAGVVPLVLGLGLAAFGIALTIADVDRSLVRTTAVWCVIGVGAMLVLVVLTLLGSAPTTPLDFSTVRSQTYLSNFLIGGSVGGTCTGLYAARTRRQHRELSQQANRLVTLNRMLRHEVLNAVTVIRGYATHESDEQGEAMSIIDERSRQIQQAIEEVSHLTTRPSEETAGPHSINLSDCLSESVTNIESRYPDVSITVDSIPGSPTVRATEGLSQVFTHLLDNAIVHGNDDSPVVSCALSRTTVAISVTDHGAGLPETQRTLLETGDIGEFDDPTTGFGLNTVRLLVEAYGGTIDTTLDESGTTITVTLARADTGEPRTVPTPADLANVRPALPHLLVGFGAGIVAAVVYGLVAELLGGSIAAIGVFYGANDLVVGWLTHIFHSIVFAFVYIGLLSVVLERAPDRLPTYVAVGIGWGLLLWVGAAGVIAPIWLRLLGYPAPIPSLSTYLLASHLAWGLSLAVLIAGGYEYVTPQVSRIGARLGPSSGWIAKVLEK